MTFTLLTNVYLSKQRELLRQTLVDAACADERIVAAALTGSGAIGAEDRWSDIDVAFSVAAGIDLHEVIGDWTDTMYRENEALDHLDVTSGAAIYRVFLLASTLQVDIAFSPEADFGAVAPTFQLLFGKARKQPWPPPADASRLIGMAWLYALHARSSIARNRVWQAEYMISSVRDHVLALACLRHGVPAVQGRGLDELPPNLAAVASETLIRSLNPVELRRAFGGVIELLVGEIGHVDGARADRLANVLREIGHSRET